MVLLKWGPYNAANVDNVYMWIFEKLDYIKISMLTHFKLERKRSFIAKSFVVDFSYHHSEYSYSIDSHSLFRVIYSN